MIQPLPGISRTRRRAGSLPPILAQHDTSAALQRAAQRRRRSQQYGNQVQHMTTKEIDAASIQRVVVAHFRKEMNAERCTLMLLDSAAEELHFRDWEQDAHEVRFDMHAGIAGEALSCHHHQHSGRVQGLALQPKCGQTDRLLHAFHPLCAGVLAQRLGDRRNPDD